MIRLAQCNKILIEKLLIQAGDRLRTFELQLPANAVEITSIMVSANLFMPTPAVIGKVSFQANDKTDIFLVADVKGNGYMHSDEAFAGIATNSFEEEGEWLNGKGAGWYPVTVEGDTVTVLCTYRSAMPALYMLRIYAVYRELEKLDPTPEALLREEAEQARADAARKALPREI